MLIGRAGVFSAINRRRKRKQIPTVEDALDYDELINYFEGDKVVFKKYPWGIWTFCTLIFIVAFFMLYHFSFGSFIHEFKIVEVQGYRVAHWWEYM